MAWGQGPQGPLPTSRVVVWLAVGVGVGSALLATMIEAIIGHLTVGALTMNAVAGAFAACCILAFDRLLRW